MNQILNALTVTQNAALKIQNSATVFLRSLQSIGSLIRKSELNEQTAEASISNVAL